MLNFPKNLFQCHFSHNRVLEIFVLLCSVRTMRACSGLSQSGLREGDAPGPAQPSVCNTLVLEDPAVHISSGEHPCAISAFQTSEKSSGGQLEPSVRISATRWQHCSEMLSEAAERVAK